jgi:aminoglycoside 6'-N-acetyltransferase I
MEIRIAEVKDLLEWVQMRTAFYSPTAYRREAELILTDISRDIAFVVVRDDGKLGGFLEASIRSIAEGCESDKVAYLEGWYIDPDLRQQGIGGHLVAAAETWAIERGCQEIASDCFLENDVSFQAHRGLGYQEINRLIHFRKALVK